MRYLYKYGYRMKLVFNSKEKYEYGLLTELLLDLSLIIAPLTPSAVQV